ncbi:MAG: proline--tRNA ligase [Alphaproteobacteria bacterium]|nr:proline--tRNA ligase [Rickettsiales bacterium]
MRVTRYYLPVIKPDPSVSASTVSHKLMLRAGMIRQLCQGIYTLLPLAHRVLKNITKIVEEECDKIGCIEMLMPTLQPATLWKKSGRYDSYGSEMLCIKDRNDKDLLYSPTNEEVITDLLSKDIISYKSLPINLYQIHWKFRDEIRPRFGLMRAREFLMLDAYSFDLNQDAAVATYYTYYKAYAKIFEKMGLTAIPIIADTGQIGGSLSHEFQIIAETGESEIIYDIELEEKFKNINKVSHRDLTNIYAVTKEKHDPANCRVDADHLVLKRGIEIGHIFSFGQKYSKSMNLNIQDKEGKTINPYMGSYGIGVTRLMAAIIEAKHDDKGIIWHESIAPFNIILFNFDHDIDVVMKGANEIYEVALNNNIDILYDDTDRSIGQKRNIADLIGVPYQLCYGERNFKDGNCEIKSRQRGKKVIVPISRIKEELCSTKNLGKFF